MQNLLTSDYLQALIVDRQFSRERRIFEIIGMFHVKPYRLKPATSQLVLGWLLGDYLGSQAPPQPSVV
jgi:hypothetical protein